MMSEDYATLAQKPEIPALPVKGCVDAGLRLVAADPALVALQEAAGSRLGGRLAVAPLADIARLARKLDMAVTREARIADADHHYEVLVDAVPDGEIVRLSIKEWTFVDRPEEIPQLESLDDTLVSPLSQIIDAAEGISAQTDGPLQENYADYAGDIATAGRHLLSVIRSMTAQVGGTSSEPVDMEKLSIKAAQIAAASAKDARVRISVKKPKEPRMAMGEARAVVQILVNILGNAMRHSPEGGTIRVRIDAADGAIETMITDEGPGIAPSDRLRIFKAFERAHDADDGGKGLGLAIARRLARGMGGDVLLGDQPERGARFTLRLPEAR